MSRGFELNKRALNKLQRDLQRELNKRPVSVPVRAEMDPVAGPLGAAPGASWAAPGTVVNGPVFYGDVNGAQLAWGNQSVTQNQQCLEQVAPGFEELALVVTQLLRDLPAVLAADDRVRAEAAAEELLGEVVQPSPDRGKVRRCVDAIRGILAPLALGVTAGAGEAVQDEAKRWALAAIEQLSNGL